MVAFAPTRLKHPLASTRSRPHVCCGCPLAGPYGPFAGKSWGRIQTTGGLAQRKCSIPSTPVCNLNMNFKPGLYRSGPKVPPSVRIRSRLRKRRPAIHPRSFTNGGTVCGFREVPFSKGLAQLTTGPNIIRPRSSVPLQNCMPDLAQASPHTHRPSIVRCWVDISRQTNSISYFMYVTVQGGMLQSSLHSFEV